MKTIIRSSELSCPSCVAKIEKSLRGIKGVQTAKVHFNIGKIEVEHDATIASRDILLMAVHEAGYEGHVSRI